MSIRLGVVQHQPPLQAAVPFLVIQGVTPFIWPLPVRLLRRVGPRTMLVCGLLAIASGWGRLGARPVTDSTMMTMLPALLAAGVGFGLLVSAITAATTDLGPASAFAREALEHGYAIGFIVSAAVCVCAAFVALETVRAGSGHEAHH
ncbi:MAG: hypothetical protein ABW215_12395 [Kibdelosporangium sp.]